MKKILTKVGFALLLGLLVASCDIERVPKGSLDAGQSLASVQDAKNWDNGLMATFRGRHRSSYDVIQDRMGDQLNAYVNFGNRGGSPHGWASLNSGDYDLRDVYRGYYSALKNVNTVIGKIESVVTETDDDKAVVKQIAGNAHFLRAFYYANLTLRFGYRYSAATADKDLSVPLVLAYNPIETPARATNKQVYDQIFEDLRIAKENLAAVKGVAMADYITVDACTALEARVRLYMADYQGAYAAAKQLADATTYPLVAPTKENIVKMWRNDQSTEEILQLYISKPDELPNTNDYYGASVSLANKAKKKINTPDWLPSKWIIDLYEDTDLRKNVYFEMTNIQYEETIWDNLYVISKFKGNPAYATVTGESYWDAEFLPNGINAPKVFRVAEMYLIAAEAASKLSDDTNAKKYLNALRASRGLAAVEASGDALFNAIKDERTRELAFEGFRLWDLRRWGMDMVRRQPQTDASGNSEFLYKAIPLNLSIKNNDFRFIWGIPSNDMNTNPNLKGQQNPGW